MGKKLMGMLATALLLAAILPAAALADESKGQKIGQNEFRLALTICSNAGIGNGGEYEGALVSRSVKSDCFDKKFLSRYSGDQIAAILAHSSCDYSKVTILGRDYYTFLCEIDPGNSASHNNAQK
jgi:hypothetical protein